MNALWVPKIDIDHVNDQATRNLTAEASILCGRNCRIAPRMLRCEIVLWIRRLIKCRCTLNVFVNGRVDGNKALS